MQRVQRHTIVRVDPLADVDEVKLQSEVFDAWRVSQTGWFDRTGMRPQQAVRLFREFEADREAQADISRGHRIAIVFGLGVICWASIAGLAAWLAQ